MEAGGQQHHSNGDRRIPPKLRRYPATARLHTKNPVRIQITEANPQAWKPHSQFGRGSENAVLAKKLGASVYIDSKATNAAEALQKLGGAQAILATAPSSKAMSELFDGLGPNGKFVVIGVASDPIEVTPLQLITGSRSIQGWASGTAADEEDRLNFAELSGVRPMIETCPLERAGEGYARMMSGKA